MKFTMSTLMLMLTIISLATSSAEHQKVCDIAETKNVIPKCVSNTVIVGVVCQCSCETNRIYLEDGSFACITGIFNCNATVIGFCCDTGFHMNITTRSCVINPPCPCPGRDGTDGINGINGTCIDPCVNITTGTVDFLKFTSDSQETFTGNPGIYYNPAIGVGGSFTSTIPGEYNQILGILTSVNGGSYDITVMILIVNSYTAASIHLCVNDIYGGIVFLTLFTPKLYFLSATTYLNPGDSLMALIGSGDGVTAVTYSELMIKYQKNN